jgi:hypothetical protein
MASRVNECFGLESTVENLLAIMELSVKTLVRNLGRPQPMCVELKFRLTLIWRPVPIPHRLGCYSFRSAAVGSTRAARRAGPKVAKKITMSITARTTGYTAGAPKDTTLWKTDSK